MPKGEVTDWDYVLDAFDLPAESTGCADPCGRALGSPYDNLDDYYSQVYEVTVNVPLEGLSVVEQKRVYETVWTELLKKHRVKAQQYFIEYCKSGQMHIHGYIEMYHHKKLCCFDDNYFLEMIARDIFLQLPKKYWKQQKKSTYHAFFRMYKTPAVCINMKEILSSNWLQYMTKTGGENSRPV